MNKKILLVDDEPSILESVSDALENVGYNVIKGHDGEEAITLYEKEKPDIVLLDIRMPVKDGLEAFFDIKKLHKDAKIIFMSAYPLENDTYQRVKENEIVYVLTKPFSIDLLLEMINEVIKNDK